MSRDCVCSCAKTIPKYLEEDSVLPPADDDVLKVSWQAGLFINELLKVIKAFHS
jgi:hypothetical protein